jgi:hypothetical protein
MFVRYGEARTGVRASEPPGVPDGIRSGHDAADAFLSSLAHPTARGAA